MTKRNIKKWYQRWFYHLRSSFLSMSEKNITYTYIYINIYTIYKTQSRRSSQHTRPPLGGSSVVVTALALAKTLISLLSPCIPLYILLYTKPQDSCSPCVYNTCVERSCLLGNPWKYPATSSHYHDIRIFARVIVESCQKSRFKYFRTLALASLFSIKVYTR